MWHWILQKIWKVKYYSYVVLVSYIYINCITIYDEQSLDPKTALQGIPSDPCSDMTTHVGAVMWQQIIYERKCPKMEKST